MTHSSRATSLPPAGRAAAAASSSSATSSADGGAAGDDKLIALLRTAVTSDAVAEQVQATLSQRLTGPIAALGADRVPERAALIAAQLLGVALGRYILRFEPLASLPG